MITNRYFELYCQIKDFRKMALFRKKEELRRKCLKFFQVIELQQKYVNSHQLHFGKFQILKGKSFW